MKRIRTLVALSLLGGVLMVPTAAQATAIGDDCVKFEDLGGASISATASNGFSATIDGFEFKDGTEVIAFEWSADGEVASVMVKSSGDRKSVDDLATFSYTQENSKGISHVVICGDPGGGGDDSGGDDSGDTGGTVFSDE